MRALNNPHGKAKDPLWVLFTISLVDLSVAWVRDFDSETCAEAREEVEEMTSGHHGPSMVYAFVSFATWKEHYCDPS